MKLRDLCCMSGSLSCEGHRFKCAWSAVMAELPGVEAAFKALLRMVNAINKEAW